MLDERLQALREIVDIARDRFDAALVDEARRVLERGTERLGFGKDLTVVALAGATGTGKSSLFNVLSGVNLAKVGVLRPTTSATQAAVWGEASEVLDWLGVARRHGVSDARLDGLVLLDLPDHDSVELDHRLEVDRLVQLVDVFVWVVDPQKYADASLHEGYLRPLATHAAVTVVVLNQVDKLSEVERRQCVSDLSRLLKHDGLDKVEVLSTSVVTGEGIGSLRETIEKRVREEQAALSRLGADLDALAERLAPHCGPTKARALRRDETELLVDALADAARVGVVSNALASAHRRDAALAMGWPFTRWLRRFRPDPLGRLHLRRHGEGGRTSLPPATPLQRAEVDNAVRRVAASAGEGLPPPWPESIKQRVSMPTDELLNDLDIAVSKTDLGDTGRPAWWSIASGVQTLLATVAVIGFAWLALLFGLEWLDIPRPPTPEVEEIPWPALALIGGLLVGFLLSVVFQGLARVGGRRRKKRAEQRLREAIRGVSDERVLSAIHGELSAHERFCKAVATLQGRPAGSA